jgi:5-(carboxyamino)imidazole ribonucleotide synthase
MTLQAAISLGVTVRLLAADPADGAAAVSPHILIGSPTSIDALEALASTCDVLTFDHELVDVGILKRLESAGHVLRPSAATMAVAQDKGLQRVRFDAIGLSTPPHARVGSARGVLAFAEEHGWPVVVKACRGGYDGRGVWMLDTPTAVTDLVARAHAAGTALLVEAWVPIEREIAVLVARRPGGEAVVYPVVETVQVGGICHELLVPAPIPASLTEEARRLALTVAAELDVAGILAVEMFVTCDGLVISEVASRPHNSGHYSIEGCVTSQFENHLRAILDWPLGSAELTAPAVATANVLAGVETGDLAAALPRALAVDGVRVHLYGKAPRPGRKVGHVTATGTDLAEVRARAARAAALLAGRTPAEVHT